MLTAADKPRALNDPVGFNPSSLMKMLGYSWLGSRGVKPSPRLTGATSGSTSA